MSKVLILFTLLFASCVDPSLKDIKVFIGDSATQSIIYKYEGEETIISTGSPLFDEYFALHKTDLEKIYLKLKKCQNDSRIGSKKQRVKAQNYCMAIVDLLEYSLRKEINAMNSRLESNN